MGIKTLRLLDKARNLVDKGEYSKAVVYLLNVLEEDPHSDEAAAELSYCYTKMDNFKKAEEYAIMAVNLNPYELSNYRNLAFVYHEFGLFEEEIDVLEEILPRLESPSAEVLFSLGRAYVMIEDLHTAIGFFKQAISINPDFEDAYLFLADTYLLAGDYELAIDVYLKLMEINPDIAEVYSGLGMIYTYKKEHLKAEKYLLKSVSLQPNNAFFRANLLTFYLDTGQTEKAVEEYKKIRQLDPQFALELVKAFEYY